MKTKLCKPILIDDEENIYKDELSLFDDKLIINSKLKSSSDTKQIVVVSLDKDDEIKSGDLITDGNSIIVAPNIDGFIGFRKIIATQDQLSPEYIQQFIEEYNNDNVKDIKIEMTADYDPDYKAFYADTIQPKLTNGFITILECPKCIDCVTKIETPIVFTEKEVLFIVELVGGDVVKAIDYIKTINKQ